MNVMGCVCDARVAGDVCANDWLSSASCIDAIGHWDEEGLTWREVGEGPVGLGVGLASDPNGLAINLVEDTHYSHIAIQQHLRSPVNLSNPPLAGLRRDFPCTLSPFL